MRGSIIKLLYVIESSGERDEGRRDYANTLGRAKEINKVSKLELGRYLCTRRGG